MLRKCPQPSRNSTRTGIEFYLLLDSKFFALSWLIRYCWQLTDYWSISNILYTCPGWVNLLYPVRSYFLQSKITKQTIHHEQFQAASLMIKLKANLSQTGTGLVNWNWAWQKCWESVEKGVKKSWTRGHKVMAENNEMIRRYKISSKHLTQLVSECKSNFLSCYLKRIDIFAY